MGVKLRLVGCKRYVDSRIRTGSAIEQGEVIDVEDEDLAEYVLQATFLDRYNEPRPMFEEVEEVEEEEEKPKKKVVRAVKSSRRRKSAQA